MVATAATATSARTIRNFRCSVMRRMIASAYALRATARLTSLEDCLSRFSNAQLSYAAGLTGYLDRAAAIEFLKKMDIKHSVGHWSAGDFCDRFAPPGYHSDDPGFGTDFESQCRRTKAAGIDAIEIHQSVFEKTLNGDLDQNAIDRATKGFLAELGLTITACNINTWTNPKFRLGGPCNPDKALRKAALEEILKGVEICKQLKISVLSV